MIAGPYPGYVLLVGKAEAEMSDIVSLGLLLHQLHVVILVLAIEELEESLRIGG